MILYLDMTGHVISRNPSILAGGEAQRNWLQISYFCASVCPPYISDSIIYVLQVDSTKHGVRLLRAHSEFSMVGKA
jgi:hypothetical protein